MSFEQKSRKNSAVARTICSRWEQSGNYKLWELCKFPFFLWLNFWSNAIRATPAARSSFALSAQVMFVARFEALNAYLAPKVRELRRRSFLLEVGIVLVGGREIVDGVVYHVRRIDRVLQSGRDGVGRGVFCKEKFQKTRYAQRHTRDWLPCTAALRLSDARSLLCPVFFSNLAGPRWYSPVNGSEGALCNTEQVTRQVTLVCVIASEAFFEFRTAGKTDPTSHMTQQHRAGAKDLLHEFRFDISFGGASNNPSLQVLHSRAPDGNKSMYSGNLARGTASEQHSHLDCHWSRHYSSALGSRQRFMRKRPGRLFAQCNPWILYTRSGDRLVVCAGRVLPWTETDPQAGMLRRNTPMKMLRRNTPMKMLRRNTPMKKNAQQQGMGCVTERGQLALHCTSIAKWSHSILLT